MGKSKNVRVRQELLEEVEKEVEKEQYQSLSEFVSEAVQSRLESAAKERVSEYFERDKQSRVEAVEGQLGYTHKHTWVEKTTQGNLRVGVTDYFSSKLKGVVYVGTGELGDDVFKDQPFGTVETVAGWPFVIHDVISPINGKIVKINKEVVDDPYLLNGNVLQWIAEIQPNSTNPRNELERLLNLEEYKKLLAELEAPQTRREES